MLQELKWHKNEVEALQIILMYSRMTSALDLEDRIETLFACRTNKFVKNHKKCSFYSVGQLGLRVQSVRVPRTNYSPDLRDSSRPGHKEARLVVGTE